MLERLLREPLVHFLGIGLLLFGLYALVGPSDTGGDKIVISRAMVGEMKARHAELWGRPPTQAELNALIDARVGDEIRYREGLGMGLDRDDAVIKRRVRQKYLLITEEEDAVEPTEADLAAYLKAHPDKFRAPPIVSYRQIMIPANGSDAEIAARAAGLKGALEKGASPAQLGQPSMLPAHEAGIPLDLVARSFGDPFAVALLSLPVGGWQGPVASAYGLHLVRLEARVPAEVPPLAAIRADVQREWANDSRLKASARREAALRKQYEVVIEAGK